MYTAPFITHANHKLQPGFQTDEFRGPPEWGPLDAPECICAGSTYSYQPSDPKWKPWDMPRTIAREGGAA